MVDSNKAAEIWRGDDRIVPRIPVNEMKSRQKVKVEIKNWEKDAADFSEN